MRLVGATEEEEEVRPNVYIQDAIFFSELYASVFPLVALDFSFVADEQLSGIVDPWM
jgi:hypothetical protein